MKPNLFAVSSYSRAGCLFEEERAAAQRVWHPGCPDHSATFGNFQGRLPTSL